MPRYHTVLLDADNTLFDFDRAEREAILTTLAHFSLPATAENAALYAGINEALWQRFNRGEVTQPFLQRERFRQLAQALGCPADPSDMDRFYRTRLGLGAYLLPGAEEFCRALYGKCTLALVTNGSGDTQRARFSRSVLTPLFEGRIFISGEMGVQKPMEAYFDAVFAALGLTDRTGVVMVGDSLTSDIAGGIRAGVDTIWYNPAGKPADPALSPTCTVTTLAQAREYILG